MKTYSTVEVNNIVVEIIHKDVKNIHLNVLPPWGDVRITAPLKNDKESIRLFIISKIPWINKQRRKFEKQERETKKEYISGESHYFNGDRYLLNIINSKDCTKVILRNKKFLDLYIDKNVAMEKRKELLDKWYRIELNRLARRILDKWSKKMKLDISDLKIKKMKTKWGSCNRDQKRIWINLDLMKKPTHQLEYVIVHELVHFLEKRHNKRFVSYMNKYLPSWRTLKSELNKFILTHEEWKRD